MLKLLGQFLLVGLSVLVSPLQSARAEPFQPDAFSVADLRVLQAALVWQGYYNGLIDGDWCELSDQATANWAHDTCCEQIEEADLATPVLPFLGSGPVSLLERRLAT